MSEKESSSPSLASAIKTFFDSRLSEVLHTCLPGKIESYNSETRKAIVAPLIKRKYLDETILSIKPIENVPVMFYGAGQAILRLPENEITGQTCTLIFTERSLDTWLNSGNISEPGSTRKFDITDAIAILSLNSFNNTDKGGNDLELQYKDSIIRIKENGNIEIGVDTFLKLINENFKTLFDNHVHYISVAGTPSAQIGVSSSPSKLTGITPLRINAAPGIVHTFNNDLTNNEMTAKTKAE